jgi:hypothetical protein
MSKNQGGAPFLRFGWLKGFAYSLLSIFAVALIHSMVAELARKLGWDQFLVYLMGPPVGTFLSYLVGQPWFWLLAGFSIGVFVGNWTARFRAKQTASQEPQIEGVQAPAHPPLPAVELQPNGEVTISHPANRDVVQPGYVAFEGTHNLDETREQKGHFWLFTQAAGKYWPQTEVTLHPDGRWQERISVGDTAGPRNSVVLLVSVTDFTHALLKDIKERSRLAKNHDPVKMDPPPKDQFLELNKLVLQIPGPPQSANQGSEQREKSRIECQNPRFVDNRHGKNRHYQLEVANISSSDIRRCQAVLKQIDRNGQTMWGGQNAALTFQPAEGDDAISKTIRPGAEQFLDIVVLEFHPFSNVPPGAAAIAYQRWDTGSGRITVRPCTKGRTWIFNETVEEIFAAGADYFLTLEIGADEMPTMLVKLKFHYEGGNSTLEIIEQRIKVITTNLKS